MPRVSHLVGASVPRRFLQAANGCENPRHLREDLSYLGRASNRNTGDGRLGAVVHNPQLRERRCRPWFPGGASNRSISRASSGDDIESVLWCG